MSSRTNDNRIPTESEYRLAVEEFDRLWSSNTLSEDQANMARLIDLIDAFESAHALPPAAAACPHFDGCYA